MHEKVITVWILAPHVYVGSTKDLHAFLEAFSSAGTAVDVYFTSTALAKEPPCRFFLNLVFYNLGGSFVRINLW